MTAASQGGGAGGVKPVTGASSSVSPGVATSASAYKRAAVA